MSTEITCSDCSGSGSQKVVCGTCLGSGCNDCGKSGHRWVTCGTCHGRGKVGG